MSVRARRAVLVVGLAGAGLVAAPSSAAPTPAVRIASVSTTGVLGNGPSQSPTLSADGKYVAFLSWADNLVPRDTNAGSDVFVRDLTRSLTRLVTQDTAGEQAAPPSAFVAGLSKDGRYVAFSSQAGNLVPGDTNGDSDAFVRDLRYGITTRVSLAEDGSQIMGSHADGISGDGRYVVFTSSYRFVVPGDDNREPDVFVRDLKKGTTRVVSVASDGTLGNGLSQIADISADGRYVVFTSHATNLVPGDTNETSDVFRHDLKTGETIRLSVGPGGRQTTGSRPGSPGTYTVASSFASISANGRLVAFYSFGDGLVDGPHAAGDVYVRDVRTSTTTLVSRGLGGAAANRSGPAGSLPDVRPDVSGDGRYVAFESWASNLVPGDTNGWADGFVHDLKKGTTRRVTTGLVGQQGNLPAYDLVIDHDGDTVAFMALANNLGPMDDNGHADVVVARLKK